MIQCCHTKLVAVIFPAILLICLYYLIANLRDRVQIMRQQQMALMESNGEQLLWNQKLIINILKKIVAEKNLEITCVVK